MKYTFQYFRGKKLVGERVWHGLHSQVHRIAVDGLTVHDVDTVKVLDDAGQEADKAKRPA